jgi:16S rRNA (uracil1498-N3)-methyltransferase
MPRFFIPPAAIRGKTFTLSGSEAHHALRVLRKKVGDEIDLFDGKDASYVGRIESVLGDELRGQIVGGVAARPLPVQLTLYQGLARVPKWEWLLEKAAEVGVWRIVPVRTQRAVVKLDAAQAREKVKRWNRISLAASKQCGRADVMSVELPRTMPEALAALSAHDLSLIPWEKETTKSIHEALLPRPPQAVEGERPANINIFIGPEGGWDAQEIELARERGVIPVRLGPTLLRTETAGIVAAALVLREFGVY